MKKKLNNITGRWKKSRMKAVLFVFWIFLHLFFRFVFCYKAFWIIEEKNMPVYYTIYFYQLKFIMLVHIFFFRSFDVHYTNVYYVSNDSPFLVNFSFVKLFYLSFWVRLFFRFLFKIFFSLYFSNEKLKFECTNSRKNNTVYVIAIRLFLQNVGTRRVWLGNCIFVIHSYNSN